MADYHLPIHESNAAAGISTTRSAIIAGTIDADGLSTMASDYRTIAACALLSRLDAEECRAWLARSGQAHLAAVSRQPASCPAAGRATALRDAIASGDFALATAVAKTLPRSWRTNEEHEDEFLFQCFLIEHALIKDREAATRIIELLRKNGDAEEDGRLRLCEALHQRDVTVFTDGLTTMLKAHKTHYQNLRSREGAPESILDTCGKICFDALAVARLGEAIGFQSADDRQFLPAIVLAGKAIGLSAESWRTVPLDE